MCTLISGLVTALAALIVCSFSTFVTLGICQSFCICAAFKSYLIVIYYFENYFQLLMVQPLSLTVEHLILLEYGRILEVDGFAPVSLTNHHLSSLDSRYNVETLCLYG